MANWDTTVIPSGSNWSIPTHKDAKATRLERTLVGALNTKIQSSHKPEIRISKLPICGLLHAIELKKDERKEEQLKDRYYTDIGNAVHTFWQTILPQSDSKMKVFGNWKCEACKAVVYERCTTPESLICPKCKKNHDTVVYEEITINYRGISGHIDMIFFDKGEYTLVDFKTTSAYNVKEPKYLPYPKHLMQAEAYCFMIENQFKIKISNYFIIYVSRDKGDGGKDKLEHTRPIGFDVTPKMLARRKAQLDQIVESRKIIKRLFDDPTPELLKELDDNRPCHKLHDYENSKTGMVHGFFGSEQCPYLENGSCFKNKKFTKPARDLWELL
jgi:hypothetical protein